MTSRRTVRALAVAVPCAALLLVPCRASAQYAEEPRVLAALAGSSAGAVQVGRRLFVAGAFSHVGPPTGSAIVVDASATVIPGGFPVFDGTVHEIIPDGYGGWVVVGGFTNVNGEPYARFARIRPDRTVDPRYRISIDGPIRRARLAHGRVYLVGDFTVVNGARRLGLAALDTATGALSTWGSGFDPGVNASTGRRRVVREISTSSLGVYVSGGGAPEPPASAADGRLWGFDAGTGGRLFERAAYVTAIAASSARVYVGGWGYQRPLWAVDPRSGADDAWATGLTFLPSGSQDARVTALLLDGARLYLGGYFRTAASPLTLVSVAAVDATTGQPSTWRAAGDDLSPTPSGVIGLVRLGPGLVVSHYGGGMWAFDVTSGARLPWDPRPFGSILTVAPAPEGAVVGGDFAGVTGEARRGLASFDLDTGQLEPWTAALPETIELDWLGTDGAFLFATTRFGPKQFLKIDPVSGAVLGTLDFGNDVYWTSQRVTGDRIVVVAGHARLGVITIATWARQTMPLALGGGDPTSVVSDLEVVGDTAYLAGTFATVNGVHRPFLAAVNVITGAVLPFDASPDAQVDVVRVASGRVFAGGPFRRIGGARRRGLAEVDPVTGRAGAWNPDAPGGAGLELGADGSLYVAPSTTVGGRNRGRLAAFSPSTGTWLPWRPDDDFVMTERGLLAEPRVAAFLPDCLVAVFVNRVSCHPRALPSPAAPTVRRTGNLVTFSWALPDAPASWTGVRVDLGGQEGASDLARFALPPDATSIAGPVPPGAYFARVRTTSTDRSSLPTADVSFAVGPPEVPAPPRDATAVTEGTALTLTWRAPSDGLPAGYVFEAGTAAGRSDVGSLLLPGGTLAVTIDAPPGRYWGRVRAMNGSGRSAPSEELVLDIDASGSPCYGSAPLAPLGLAALVAGHTVVLSWVQPDTGAVANAQYIVAGSAPGLADVAIIGAPGSATRFETTAPAGTYYVRVFGANDCGAGASSNEIRLVVP